jgi:hypothetical protein
MRRSGPFTGPRTSRSRPPSSNRSPPPSRFWGKVNVGARGAMSGSAPGWPANSRRANRSKFIPQQRPHTGPGKRPQPVPRGPFRAGARRQRIDLCLAARAAQDPLLKRKPLWLRDIRIKRHSGHTHGAGDRSPVAAVLRQKRPKTLWPQRLWLGSSSAQPPTIVGAPGRPGSGKPVVSQW